MVIGRGRVRPSGRAALAMMHSADLWYRNDPSFRWRLDSAWYWRVAFKAEVGACFVVMDKVARKDAPEMAFVEDDHVVETLAPNRADDSLDVRISPRRSGRSDDFLDAHVLDAIVEGLAVDAVAVAEDEPRSLFVRECLEDLLCSPLCRWVRGDVEVYGRAPIMAEYDEAVEDAEGGGGDGEGTDAGCFRSDGRSVGQQDVDRPGHCPVLGAGEGADTTGR